MNLEYKEEVKRVLTRIPSDVYGMWITIRPHESQDEYVARLLSCAVSNSRRLLPANHGLAKGDFEVVAFRPVDREARELYITGDNEQYVQIGGHGTELGYTSGDRPRLIIKQKPRLRKWVITQTGVTRNAQKGDYVREVTPTGTMHFYQWPHFVVSDVPLDIVTIEEVTE